LSKRHIKLSCLSGRAAFFALAGAAADLVTRALGVEGFFAGAFLLLGLVTVFFFMVFAILTSKFTFRLDLDVDQGRSQSEMPLNLKQCLRLRHSLPLASLFRKVSNRFYGVRMNAMVKWFFGSLLVLSALPLHAQNVNGTLRVVKGDVQIKSGKTGQTAKARLGTQVFPKDVIITGADSRAKIVMVDNNEINISPDSQLEIKHYEFDPNQGKKEVLLNVLYGKVRNKVEQHYDGKTSKFEVKTPAAVAGVRGTDFMTSYDRASGESQVVTFRGAVGKMASSTGGAAPSTPSVMTKAQMAKMDNETKAEPPGPTKAGPQPASEGNKSNSSGSSSAPSSGANGTAGPSASTGQSSGDLGGSRAPASSSMGVDPSGGAGRSSMLSTDDLTPNTSNSVMAPPPPPPPMMPVMPTITPLPTCSTCNQMIQGGQSANLVVKIK
jgi:hypothetical protein